MNGIKCSKEVILSFVDEKYHKRKDLLFITGGQVGIYKGKLKKDASKMNWVQEPWLYVKVNPKYVNK